MSAFIYGLGLQWKMDIRSKSLLITCYVVPLLFFILMSGIFISVTPETKYTLIQSMTIMGVSMGALIGLPPSISETYGSDIRKVYKANGVPLAFGLLSMFISAFIHLLIMSLIIYVTAPIFFGAILPANPFLYFCSLCIFIIVSLGIGCVLGLAFKKPEKLTMISQLIFLPSIMLSGILVSTSLLPNFLGLIGKIFPASWGYQLMINDNFNFNNLWFLLIILIISILLCGLLLKRQKSE